MKRTLLALIALAFTLASLSTTTPAQRRRPPRRPPPASANQTMNPASFTLQESSDEVTIKTPAYDLIVSREGFAVRARRAGRIVLESARGEDAHTNLEFERDGKQRVTRLRSFKRIGDTIAFDYDTSKEQVKARIEIRPARTSARLATWLLNNAGYTLTPSLHFRLASSGSWYGGGFQGFRSPQIYPLNRARINQQFFTDGETQGTPVWYTTEGVALWLRTPGEFRYIVNRETNNRPDGLFSIEMPNVTALTYDIRIGGNVRDVVQEIIREVGFPRVVPPEDYFRLPIYTTWVEHKTEVSQAKVLEYAREIRRNNLPCGVIEIDDKWEDQYGDMRFDRRKFPNPKQMVDELHRQGFRVTLWIHPFVNVEADSYAELRNTPMLVRDASGNSALIRWWQGVAAVWDLTNHEAAARFRLRLKALQQTYGFDGFKFDGADVKFLPRDMQTATHITPAEYADVYNREATAQFTWNEARVGVYSQRLGIIQRIIDKQSVWTNANGLAALVPEALIISLRGYPYVMPDMIGGNQYDGDVIDKELLIRWAQASALMPLVQFSRGAWHFDEETTRIAREASELHMRFTPYIYRLAQSSPRTGEPIIAPLWYHAPEDKETFEITDEFMLGTDVVVAPVVVQRASKRDVYLPAGRWRDEKTREVVRGGRWLRDYPAALDVLPVFIREGSSAGR